MNAEGATAIAEAGVAPRVPTVEMRGVTVGALRDPKITVAEHVSWRVEPGEFWAIAGLHGSGKTDFLMFTAGLMGPVSGSYKFLGETMPIFSEEGLPHRLKLGLVFDGARLFKHLTIAENIALPLRYHRNLSAAEAAAEVGALMELTGLGDFAHLTPGSLGRNWQRRAALARALALRPELLLLDAPLVGLDLRQHQWWLGFLDRLARGHPFNEDRPMTLVVTSANLSDWRGHAGRFALLEGRRLTTIGDWSDVERSGDALVQELRSPGMMNP